MSAIMITQSMHIDPRSRKKRISLYSLR